MKKEIEVTFTFPPDIRIGSDYKPTVIESNGNKYVILNKYIAGNLRQLLLINRELKFPFSNGDWWDDALSYIPEDWAGNGMVEDQVRNYHLWLEKQDKDKHVHEPSKERHAVQLSDWQTIESVKCSKCGIWYKA